jgi:hypothetical protein
MFFTGKMSLNIPENLKKYCSLSVDGTIIDRFKCPVPDCTFTTRLGPGAIRMHLLLKSDPLYESRYDPLHEAYFKEHENELTIDNIRVLSKFLFRDVSSRTG